jgi:hypothetical protein
MKMTSPFDLLEGQRYMRLTTFRRSGEVERAQNAYLKARDRRQDERAEGGRRGG